MALPSIRVFLILNLKPIELKEQSFDKDVEKIRKDFMVQQNKLKEEKIIENNTRAPLRKIKKRSSNYSMDFSGALVSVIPFPEKKLKRFEHSVVNAKVVRTSIIRNIHTKVPKFNIVKNKEEESVIGKKEHEDYEYADLSSMEPSAGVTLRVKNEVKKGASMRYSAHINKTSTEPKIDTKELYDLNDVDDINIAKDNLIAYQNKGNTLKSSCSAIPTGKSKRYNIKLPSIRKSSVIATNKLSKSIGEQELTQRNENRLPSVENRQKSSLAGRYKRHRIVLSVDKRAQFDIFSELV